MGRNMINRQFPLEIERTGMKYKQLTMSRKRKGKHRPDTVWSCYQHKSDWDSLSSKH